MDKQEKDRESYRLFTKLCESVLPDSGTTPGPESDPGLDTLFAPTLDALTEWHDIKRQEMQWIVRYVNLIKRNEQT